MITDEGAILLAKSIVNNAVEEYDYKLKSLKRHPNNTGIRSEVESLEHFFRSKWFSSLCQLDPDYLITLLRQKVDRDLEKERKGEQKSGKGISKSGIQRRYL